MSTFSIDDVRDTFQPDVTRLLDRVGSQVAQIADRYNLPPQASEFSVVGEAGHALYGTTALVGADSIATTAKYIEHLAGLGQREAQLAAYYAERARSLAQLMNSGCTEMVQMLQLELAKKREEADVLSRQWRTHIDTALASFGLTPPSAETLTAPAEAAGPPSGFDFSEAETAAPAGAAPTSASSAETFDFEEGSPAPTHEATAAESSEMSAIDAELREVFETEAREHLLAMQGYLETLYADATDATALRALERLFHTMKGAAATIGLERASASAKELQNRMQKVLDDESTVDRAFLDGLVRDTVALLSSAGMPNVTIVVGQGKATGAATKGQAVPLFSEALDTGIRDMEEILSRLSESNAPEQPASDLAQLSTRLKDSATQVGQATLAKELGKLESVATTSPVDVPAVRREVERFIAEHPAGQATTDDEGSPGELTRPYGLHATEETMATFREEARRLVDHLSELAEQDPGPNQRAGHVEQVRVLLHRLKGGALVSGATAAAEAAANHHRALTELTSVSSEQIKAIISELRQVLGFSESRSDRHPLQRFTVEHANPELWQAFLFECSEVLENIDQSLYSLENSERPREVLDSLLSSFHTLKGVANTMGMTCTGELLHRVEDFLEGLLKAPVLPALTGVTSALVRIQTETRRHIKQAESGIIEYAPSLYEELLSQAAAGGVVGQSAILATKESSVHDAHSSTLHSRGDVYGETLSKKFVRVGIDRLDSLMTLAGELVVSRGRLMARMQGLKSMHFDLARESRRIVDTVDRFCEEHDFVHLDGQAMTMQTNFQPKLVQLEAPRAKAAGAELSTRNVTDFAWTKFSELEFDRYEDIHILSRSLAELNNDIADILSQLNNGLRALNDDSEAFGSIVSGIQSQVMQTRMVQLDVLFSRLRLPIRDAAIRVGKEVRVITEGENVHLDKTIADALFQPMLHLVRNAVAHGIESPDTRRALGKAPQGVIELVARQEAGQVLMEVRDDGGGLNLARLRAQGIAMGLIDESVGLEDPRVRELVFAPGLSTEGGAHAVAGRGRGGEIVRKTIERLGGSIHVESHAGRGTRFVVALPLTLAITRALLIESANHTFAIPLHFTERILSVEEQETAESAGLKRVKLNDTYLPVTHLASLLGQTAVAATGPIVVLRVGGERILVQVDALFGQEEIVVKNLGDILAGHELFAGVTIRGTGQMVLVLDVPGLAEARQRALAPLLAHAAGAPKRPTLAKPAREARIEMVQEGAIETKPGKERTIVPAQPVKSEITAPPVEHSSSDRPMRVLFVDDSLSVRKVAEKTLTSLGVSVALAVDGMDALNKLREGSFDMVFTDLEMPRMHGFELIRELRTLAAYRDLPIVVVTSRSGQKHQDQARELGANEYITKPFTAKSLDAALTLFRNRVRGSTP